MRKVLGLLLAPVALAGPQATDMAQQAHSSQAEIAAQEVKISNSMGKQFRSKYAPDMPAIPAQSYDASQGVSQPDLEKKMGDFFKGKYAAPYTAGIPASGASSGDGSEAQRQQAIAANMGKQYRSQFVSPAVEAQAEAQQKATDAQMRAASKLEQSSTDATPELLLEAAGPAEDTTTKPPVPQSATDCTTKDELDAWYKAQSDNLKKFVPKAYQQYPLSSLKKEYDTNLKRIEAPPTEAPIKPDDLQPVALESKQGATAETPDKIRQAVDETQREVQSQVDSAIDRASNKFNNYADRVKHGFDSAAQTMRSKADAAADKVPGVRAEVQKRLHQDEESPKILAAKSASPLASRSLTALMLMMCSGGLVGLWLQQRSRRPAEELMSEEGFEYHIQA